MSAVNPPESDESFTNACEYTHLFSQEELNTACNVIKKLGANLDIYNSRPLRDLRLGLQPLFEIQKKAMFGGHNPQEYSFKKLRRMRMGQEKLNQRVKDQHFIKQTKLRAGRIKQLEILSTQEGLVGMNNIPMILDGAVIDDQPEVRNVESNDNKSDQINLLNEARACYICKKRFKQLHHFYDTLCPDCADLNWSKRNLTVDMAGRVCLVTGGRVKIGFNCCLKLLRCGATVIVTSRFPADTARRFMDQADCPHWQDRIHIYGLDLRHLPAIELFCDLVLRKYERLDVIINNACQTIRRPPAYYSHLMEVELLAWESHPPPLQQLLRCNHEFESLQLSNRISVLDAAPSLLAQPHESQPQSLSIVASTVNCIQQNTSRVASEAHNVVDLPGPSPSGSPWILTSAALSQLPLVPDDVTSHSETQLFPISVHDVNHQQVDLRSRNSWLLCMHEVSTPELVEVFTINSISPFVLIARLKPLMARRQPHAPPCTLCSPLGAAVVDTSPAISRASQSTATTPLTASCTVQSLASTIIHFGKLQDEDTAQLTTTGKKKASRQPRSPQSELAVDSLTKRRKDESDAWRGGEAYKGHGPGAASSVHGANADRTPASDCRFVVNVSSMEGKFYRRKLATHPHTNMAKAALNMLTRTSAADYQKSGIYMTAVDTGWINDENPLERAARIAADNNFATPLDELDAAARILDPVLAPLLEAAVGDGACSPAFGCFLKDFFVTEW